MDNYNEKYQDKMLKVVLITGGFIHGMNAVTGENVLNRFIGGMGSRIIFLAFAAAALMLVSERDYYLPFLGDCVFPNGLLANHVTPNGADTMITAVIQPHTKAVYWAAEPCMENCEVPVMAWDAYQNYTNSGVAVSDENGVVKFMVRGPQAYNIPFKESTLQPHVHYRYLKNNGMWSRIYTAKI